jgi:hypothetical protein
VFVVHVESGVRTSSESRWFPYVALSLVTERDTDLDEYGQLIDGSDMTVHRVDGHIYSIFPIGAPLVAAPVVFFVQHALGALEIDMLQVTTERASMEALEVVTASLVVAATASVLFATVARFSGLWQALLLVCIFAFGTSAWSTGSRALWQHAPSMLMLSIALYLFTRADERPDRVQWAGIPLAFAYVIHPINTISLAVLSVYVLVRHRRYALRFFAGIVIVAVPLLLFNLNLYGSFLTPSYAPARLGHPYVAQALLGTLVSPARGLFVFTPVLLLAFVGIAIRLRQRRWRDFDAALATIVLLHWITIASFANWWGGHSFGPRLFTDTLPYWIYFLVPAVDALGQMRGARRAIYGTVLTAVLLASVLIHHRGATHRRAWDWNSTPINVDLAPERIWDWRDLQFLR